MLRPLSWVAGRKYSSSISYFKITVILAMGRTIPTANMLIQEEIDFSWGIWQRAIGSTWKGERYTIFSSFARNTRRLQPGGQAGSFSRDIDVSDPRAAKQLLALIDETSTLTPKHALRGDLQINKKIKPAETAIFLQRSTRKAIELYGLTFDDKLDDLLGTGLKENTLTYLYKKRVSGFWTFSRWTRSRTLAGALFVDAGNSAEPYLIRREADLEKGLYSDKETVAINRNDEGLHLSPLTNFVIDPLPLPSLKECSEW